MYKTNKNYNDPDTVHNNRYEDIDPESDTKPGEAKSIKEIMQRALTGIMPVQKNLEFFDMDDLENVFERPVDFTDIDESRQYLQDLGQQVEVALQELESNTQTPADPPEPPVDPPAPPADPITPPNQ